MSLFARLWKSDGGGAKSSDGAARGTRVLFWRIGWATVATSILTVFAMSLPAYFGLLQTVCSGSTCVSAQPSPSVVRALHQVHVSLDEYAVFGVLISVLISLVWFLMAAVIVWNKSDDRMALLVALMLVALGSSTTTNTVASSSSAWKTPAELAGLLAFALLFLVFSLFPNGRFVPRWTRWLVVGLVLFYASDFLPGALNYPVLGFLLAASLSLGMVAAQIYRYRRISGQMQRQQTKLIFFSVIAIFLGEIGLSIPQLITPSLDGSLYSVFEAIFVNLIPLLIPFSFGAAILRYRLWDIDIVINRTLVYGALTACVVSIYVLVVVYLGAMFKAQGSLPVSLAATGVVAVLFAPLRNRLQRVVNRLMYGERDDPYAVLSRLGRRLDATVAPNAALNTIVETVAQALKLPYAAVSLDQYGKGKPASSYGTPTDDSTILPLSYQAEPVGAMILSPRARGEDFSSSDMRLLEDLARQIGVAVHAVRLTADLQRSRERLVATREEERRRLRRDLHDGLGPQLAAQTLKVGSARSLYRRDPEAADALLAGLESDMEAALADVRRLVYDLRPPALDELGLVGAIRETAAAYNTNSLCVIVEAPEDLPPLPAAVEVAAYRIVQEAMTNVVRHAHADTCRVRLSVGGALELEVTDEGIGLPEDRRAGVGLTSMRERAAELGGTFEVRSVPKRGASILVHLPLPDENSVVSQEQA